MRQRPILVVDDDPKTLRLLRMQLESLNFIVSTVLTAEKAWARILRTRPRLVLTDLRLPGWDGLELVARIRADARVRHLPIVLVSGNATREERLKARAAGCDAFVAKPWDARRLGKTLARLLARRSAAGRVGKRKRRSRRIRE